MKKAIDAFNPVNLYRKLNKVISNGLISGKVSRLFFYKNGEQIKDYDRMQGHFEHVVKNYTHLYPGMSIHEKMMVIPQRSTIGKRLIQKALPVLNKTFLNLNRNLIIKDEKATQLHTVEINTPGSDRYIIALLGDREVLEGKIRSFSQMAKNNRVNVLTFNYRGRGESTGKARSVDDIINDSILMVKNLMAQGIDANRIGLYGKCFGGAVACMVAEYLHKDGERVHLFADRTFDSLTHVFMGMKFGPDQDRENAKKSFFHKLQYRLLKAVAPFFMKLGLNMANWEIEVSKAYRNIPEAYKAYMQVQSPRTDKEQKSILEDGLISNRASLHFALKKDRKLQKKQIKDRLLEIEKKIETRSLQGNDANASSDYQQLHNEKKICHQQLDQMRERKMFGFDNPKQESVKELYEMNSKIHRIEDLREGLILHDALYDALLKLEDPNTPGVTEAQREQGRLELKEALIGVGKMLSGRDITKNGRYVLPSDIKTYIEKSMVIIDLQLTKLLQNVLKKDTIEMYDKLSISLEEEKITRRLPHYSEMRKLTSRSITRDINAEDYFNEWVGKVGLSDGRKDEKGKGRQSLELSNVPKEPSKRKSQENSTCKEIDLMKRKPKILEPHTVFATRHLEYPLRNVRDYAMFYGSLAGSAALFGLSIGKGNIPGIAITGYVSAGLLGIGTASALLYKGLDLDEVRQKYEDLRNIRKIDLNAIPLFQKKKLKQRLDAFGEKHGTNRSEIKEKGMQNESHPPKNLLLEKMHTLSKSLPAIHRSV
jgi:hypothetical protein